MIISPDELDTLDPEKSRTIDIEDFVDLAEIDPVYYDHPYYLVPDKGAAKAYGLLLNAMQESGRVAIARVVLRSKEQLVAIRPDQRRHGADDGDDDLRRRGRAQGGPRRAARGRGAARSPTARSQMAQQLIESLVTDFEPERYKDEYREKVLELIEAKAAGEEITAAPEAPAPTAKVPGPDGRARGEPRRRRQAEASKASSASKDKRTPTKS